MRSNDAYIVLDDADLDVAGDACITARNYNNGQTCVNGKRFIVTAKTLTISSRATLKK